MFAVFALKKSFNNVENDTMKSKIDGFVSEKLYNYLTGLDFNICLWPKTLPGLLGKGFLVLLSFMRDKENSGLTWDWILPTRSLHYREFGTVRVGIVQSSLQHQYKYPQQGNQYYSRGRWRRFNIFVS